MMETPILRYEQGTGFIRDLAGAFVSLGWAGNGVHKNNPGAESIKDCGPLPRGLYTVGEWHTDHYLGPIAARLTPHPSNEMFSRDGFWIHGPAEEPRTGQESRGCLVITRIGRMKVRDLAPEGSVLEVVA